MANHPNRGWRSRWTTDLESASATHIDGWVFHFSPSTADPGAWDGQCVAHPTLTQEMMQKAPRIAREAGEAWKEARDAKP